LAVRKHLAGSPSIAAEAKQLQYGAGSAYEAQLAENNGVADDYKAGDKVELEKRKEEAKKDTGAADLGPSRSAPKVATTPPRTYITTEGTKNKQPMDLDEAPRKPDTRLHRSPMATAATRAGLRTVW